MANKEDYDKAIQAARAGLATQSQIDLVKKAAKQAGSMGSRAREALR